MPTPEWPIRDEPPGMDLQADPPGDVMPPQGSEATSCNYPIDNAEIEALMVVIVLVTVVTVVVVTVVDDDGTDTR